MSSTESERELINNVLSLIRDRYVDAYNKLLEIYSKSDRNKLYYEFRIVHRFIRCNFGEYDQFNYDIDASGNYEFEEVKCPLRGECLYEGVVCKPKLTTELTDREMMVFRLLWIICKRKRSLKNLPYLYLLLIDTGKT